MVPTYYKSGFLTFLPSRSHSRQPGNLKQRDVKTTTAA